MPGYFLLVHIGLQRRYIDIDHSNRVKVMRGDVLDYAPTILSTVHIAFDYAPPRIINYTCQINCIIREFRK